MQLGKNKKSLHTSHHGLQDYTFIKRHFAYKLTSCSTIVKRKQY